MSLHDDLRAAMAEHEGSARSAFTLLRSWCAWQMPRVPGCDTVIRLAYRISLGHSIEEAAGREYLYRWNLAIKPSDQVFGSGVRNPCVSVFGAPHPLGM